MSSYPEHEKLRALDGANDTVGQFIDWLHGSGMRIAEYGYPYEQQVFVSVKNMGRADRRRLEELIESRDCVAIGEWLEENDFADEIVLGSSWGWGYDEWMHKIALPDPAYPEGCWYVTFRNMERLVEVRQRTEELIGMFFGIDPRKLSEEKDQMLADIRAANAA